MPNVSSAFAAKDLTTPLLRLIGSESSKKVEEGGSPFFCPSQKKPGCRSARTKTELEVDDFKIPRVAKKIDRVGGLVPIG